MKKLTKEQQAAKANWNAGYDDGWDAALEHLQGETIRTLVCQAEKGPIYDGHGREVPFAQWLLHRVCRLRASQ